MIELAIVLSIISVVSCMVIPSFSILEKASLKKVATELKMDIIYAQNQAIKNNKKYFVKFLNAQNTYTVSHGSFEPIDKKVQLAPEVKMGEMAFTQNKEISFTPKGTASSSGHIYLKTEHYKVEITISVVTGRVRIHKIEHIK